MTQTENKEKALVTVYGFGGCGINQAFKFRRNIVSQEMIGMPDFKVYYADTSDTNTDQLDQTDLKNFYRVPGMTGAGKMQSNTFAAAHDKVNEMLRTMKPGNFNIITAGAGGGSGSVLSILTALELNRRGLPTVVFLTGSTISTRSAENTYNCLANMQNLAKRNSLPVTMMYFEHRAIIEGEKQSAYFGDREAVDNVVIAEMASLSLLVSEEHDEQDREDIVNWLHYNKVTTVPGQLCDLVITRRPETLSNLKDSVISVATLLTDRSQQVGLIPAQYETTAYYKDSIRKDPKLATSELANSYFAITPIKRQPRLDYLKQKVEDLKAAADALKEMAAKSEVDVETNEDGWVL